MSDDKEERIRAKAYGLWERAGRPHGEHDRHWQEAVQSLEGDAESIVVESEGTTNAVKVAKVAKPKTPKGASSAAAPVVVPKPAKAKATK